MKCAVDPGKFKAGFALAENDGTLIFSAVIPSEKHAEFVAALEQGRAEWFSAYLREGKLPKKLEFDELLTGSGTTCKELLKQMEGRIKTKIADEYGTTLEGRKLYWKLHPPKGIWKLVPTTLRVPPRDVDDLAAWAIILKAITNDE